MAKSYRVTNCPSLYFTQNAKIVDKITRNPYNAKILFSCNSSFDNFPSNIDSDRRTIT